MTSAGLPRCHRKRGAGLCFSPFLWFWEDGDQVWATIFTVAQPLPQVFHELPGSNQPLSLWAHSMRKARAHFHLATWSLGMQLKSPSGWASYCLRVPYNMHSFSHIPTFQPVQRLFESGSDTAQLLPSPDVAWNLNFSGGGIHSPSRCVPPLCISCFISIPPSDFQHPGPSWCQAALPALVGEGAGDLALLPVSSGRHQVGVPQKLRTLRTSQGPYPPSAVSSPSVF